MDFYIGINKSTTYLPRIIDLTGYEVAPIDLYVPTAILHSGTSFEIRVSTDSGVSFSHTVEVKLPETYHWSSKAIAGLAKVLVKYATVTVDDNGHVRVVTNSDEVQLQLPHSLSRIFGLNTTLVTSQGVSGTSLVAYEILHERVLVFCNFIHPYLVHGRYMPCLYAGPPSQFSQQGHYKRTVNGQFYSLNIVFYNVFWEPVSLPDESYSLMLHFRKP